MLGITNSMGQNYNVVSETWNISADIVNNLTAYTVTTSSFENTDELILQNLGEKRKDIVSVIFLTIVYSVIFVTGVVGNLSTCIVIWKNPYMHTVTNHYLFNLAVSDVLTLILGK